MNNNKNDNINKKRLHGNSARIDPKKSVNPRFVNYVINDYKDERCSYHRLDTDFAEFSKREVDENEL